jgi:hypothetical protein
MSDNYFDWAEARYHDRARTVRAASHKPPDKRSSKEASPEPATQVDPASITLSKRIPA